MRINTNISAKLVENSAEGVWVVDTSNNTIYVNQVLSEMLGYPQEAFIGKKISDFMPEREAEDLEEKLSSRKDGKSELHQVRLFKSNGASIWASAACSPILDDQKNYIGAVGLISDITERRKNEIILEAQRSVFEILIRGGALREALDALLRPVEKIVDGVLPSVLLLEPESNKLFHASSFNIADEFQKCIDGTVIGANVGTCGASAFRKELVITEDILTDPNWDELRHCATKYGLRSCWSSPITTPDGKVLGTFAMYFREIRKPTAFELDVIKNISSAAALSFEHNNLYQRVKKHNEQMAFLAEAREILAHSIEYETVLNGLPELIVRKGLGSVAFICLKDEDGVYRTQTVASRKEDSEIIKSFQTLEFDLSSNILISRSIKENDPIIHTINEEFFSEQLLRKDQNAPNPKYIKALKELGMKCSMTVPLTVREEVIGGLMVITFDESKNYRSDDLDLMIEVARSCATAIDNARLYLESKNSVRAREEFISIASHELRTPLTSLKMRIDLLSMMIEKGEFPESVIKKLYPIVTEIKPDVQKFTKLIETLLDISKLGSKRLSLNLQQCDLSKLVKDEAHRLLSDFKFLQTPLLLEIEDGIMANCDPVRIQQVVANLLTNALKFGDKKPVLLRARAAENMIRIEVLDQGIGISEFDQKRIFQPFERAVSDKHFGGLGLGLFITKQIIEGHRGAIEVNSSLGKGTVFIVRLPAT